MDTINKAKLLALLAKIHGERNASQESTEKSEVQKDINSSQSLGEKFVSQDIEKLSEKDDSVTTDKYGNLITYNSKQQEFISLATKGESCVLIGAAGTGKTTCMKGTALSLIQSGIAGILSAEGHKYLSSGTPGIAVVAFTRRAVANIRRNMPEDMKANCITIHKLLEYEPHFYEVPDGDGGFKNKMAFEPRRNQYNPLPSSIKVIFFEETSMLGIDLFMEVIRACPHNPQLIFLGDIQQLPPVFGPAILGFKLLELPVVELTEVYRQALESPIISLAHRILSGNPLPEVEFHSWNVPSKLTLKAWKKKISADDALKTIGAFFKEAHTKGAWDPEDDIILLPFNKAFGTDELNKILANYLSKKRGAVVHEIVAGFNKIYLSAGERVLYDKEDATVIDIQKNISYQGARYAESSTTLDYWGFDPIHHESKEDLSDDAVDFLLAQVAKAEVEDRVHKASHVITLRMNDSDIDINIDTASAINSLLLGYALTVHKSQGSEWRKVFFISHQSHATMLQRELLYTAITRAREELIVICEPETLVNGIASQRVKGNTLAEKATHFKGKIEEGFDYTQS